MFLLQGEAALCRLPFLFQNPIGRPPFTFHQLLKILAGEQIGHNSQVVLFLYEVEPIVDKIGRGGVDGFAGAPSKAVIAKGPRQSRIADPDQLIAGIPAIRRRPAGIGECR